VRNFRFSEEQRLTQSSIRGLLERELPATAVRAAWKDDAPRPSPAWAKLAELGVVGLTVPEAFGGMGGTDVDLLLALEECGRAALPDPILETTAVGAPLLATFAGDARVDGWLSRIATGESTVSVVLPTTVLAVDADIAEVVLIGRGNTLFAASPASLGLVRQRSVDGARHLFSIGNHPGPADLIAEGERVVQALSLAEDRGAVAASAMLLGLARKMLDMTIEYVKVRTQFGVAVGSFQAVKHHLASAHLAVEVARPVVARGALALVEDASDRAVWVSLAKARASDAATLASRAALQCHGAIGYSYEHDLHLFMKRAWALAATYGDAASHRARIASAILGLLFLDNAARSSPSKGSPAWPRPTSSTQSAPPWASATAACPRCTRSISGLTSCAR
jgi:alkylation response protein AidB-like acyl-CoA dehydrogenase